MRCDRVRRVEDVVRKKSKRYDPSRRKQSVTPPVALRIIAHVMRITIDLDRHGGLAAIEIKRIGIDWVLTTKFETARPRPQMLPQGNLGG